MKAQLSLDKHAWHPSPLVGQITLVTTLNADGTANVAPKSWVSMMAFEPPILALGCNLSHQTAQNVLARREFVVNVPGAELARVVWESDSLAHPRPVEALGLNAIPSLEIGPPRVAECKAHLECVLDRHLVYGNEVILLGRIVAVSVDRAALDTEDPYEYLKLFVYLENRAYGIIKHREGF